MSPYRESFTHTIFAHMRNDSPSAAAGPEKRDAGKHGAAIRPPGGRTGRLAWGALAAAVLLAGAQAQPAPDQNGCVGKAFNTRAYVTVENIRSDLGQITITLYPDDSSRFLRPKGSLYVRRVPTQMPRTRICFLIPKPGVYGIAVYHDENKNGVLDRPFILPTEGFGFSNNASTVFGIPRFSAIRIHLEEGTSTEISLRYLREDELKRVGH